MKGTGCRQALSTTRCKELCGQGCLSMCHVFVQLGRTTFVIVFAIVKPFSPLQWSKLFVAMPQCPWASHNRRRPGGVPHLRCGQGNATSFCSSLELPKDSNPSCASKFKGIGMYFTISLRMFYDTYSAVKMGDLRNSIGDSGECAACASGLKTANLLHLPPMPAKQISSQNQHKQQAGVLVHTSSQDASSSIHWG